MIHINRCQPKLSFGILIIIFALPVLAGEELAGHTPGSFSHSQQGSAQYSIPLNLPPGTAGLAPSIAFTYDSGGGNGSMGVGWSLQAGLSAITRVGKSIEIDGLRTSVTFTDADQLALDGQRLIKVEGQHMKLGAVYRTRIESWQRVEITADGDHGPTGFTITNKSGHKRYFGYGHDPDKDLAAEHAVVASGSNPTIKTWLLGRIEDLDLNHIHIRYQHSDPGGSEYYPLRFYYTDNDGAPSPERMVHFAYETRPDLSGGYRSGVPTASTQRLTDVFVFVDSDGDGDIWEPEGLYRRYQVVYENDSEREESVNYLSRVVSIQEFAGGDPDSDRFPKTLFQWSGGNQQVGFASQSNDVPNLFFSQVGVDWEGEKPLGHTYNRGTHLIDINGDGLKDVIRGHWRGDSANDQGAEITKEIWLNMGNGWQQLTDNDNYLKNWKYSEENPNTLRDDFVFAGIRLWGKDQSVDMGTKFLDINGDGLIDMMQLLDAREMIDENGDLAHPSFEPGILLNTGDGWQRIEPGDSPWGNWLDFPRTHANQGASIFHFARIWRDDDPLVPNDPCEQCSYKIRGVQGGLEVADLNGDGLPDLIQGGPVRRPCPGNEDCPWDRKVFINTFNGDPQSAGWDTDNKWDDTWSDTTNVFNTHIAFAWEEQQRLEDSYMSNYGTRLADINGDGLADIITLMDYEEPGGDIQDLLEDIQLVYLNRGPEIGFQKDWSYSNSLGNVFFTRVAQVNSESQVRHLGTRLFDVNGDGLPDLFTLYLDGSETRHETLLINTGTSFVDATGTWTFPGEDSMDPDENKPYFEFHHATPGRKATYGGGLRLADINGDGLADLLNFFKGNGRKGPDRQDIWLQYHHGNDRGWALASAAGNLRTVYSGLPANADHYLYFDGIAETGQDWGHTTCGTRVDDVNGDGRLDFIQLFKSNSSFNYGDQQRVFYAAGGALQDDGTPERTVNKLVFIQSGSGATRDLEYRSLASFGAGVYTRGDDVVYPLRNLQPASFVLSSTELHQNYNEGILPRSSRTTSYHYEGLRFRAERFGQLGRGSQGFRWVKSRDEEAQKETHTRYLQDQMENNDGITHDSWFPLVGRVDVNATVNTAGTESELMKVQHLSYSTLSTTAGVFRVRSAETGTNSYENGVFLYRTEKGVEHWDDYDNPLRTVDRGRTDIQGDEFYTHLQYYNSSDYINNWQLNYLLQKKVTASNNPLGNPLSQETFVYDDERHLERHGMLKFNNDRGINQYLYRDFTYTTVGAVKTESDTLGNITTYTYDPLFHTFVESTVNALGHATGSVYDYRTGLLQETTDANGVTTKFEYDAFGRNTDVKARPPENDTSWRVVSRNFYQWINSSLKNGMRLTRIERRDWSPLEWSTSVDYKDSWGRTYKHCQCGDNTTADDNIWSYTQFDDQGRVVFQTTPYHSGDTYGATRTAYDDVSRPILLTHPNGDRETFRYEVMTLNEKPYLSTVQETRHRPGTGGDDETGQILQTVFDHENRPLRRLYDDGGQVTYEYDRLGRIDRITSQENHMGQTIVSLQKYDTLGNKYEQTEEVIGSGSQVVESNTHQFWFDAANRLTDRITPNSHKTTRHYDGLGRLTLHELNPDEQHMEGEVHSVKFTYDNTDPAVYGIGRLSSVEGLDPAQGTVYQTSLTYDKYGNTTGKTVYLPAIGDQEFAYDYRSNRSRKTLTYPDGSVLTTRYNAHGWLMDVELEEEGTDVVTISFLDHNVYGSPRQVQYGNGVVTDYDYEPKNGRLSHMTVGLGTDTYLDKDYEWDGRGLLTGIVDGLDINFTEDFTYDSMSRLVAADGPYGFREYDYDPAQNLILKGESGVDQWTYSSFTGSKLNRLDDGVNDKAMTFVYDPNGNTTGRYRWDVVGDDDLLVQEELFFYDPMDRMVRYENTQGETTNLYLYDQSGRRLKKTESDGAVTFYVSPAYEVVLPTPGCGECKSWTKYVAGSAGMLAQVTREADLPDLVITQLAGEATDYETLSLNFTLMNQGDLAGGAFRVKIAGDTDQQVVQVGALNPGQSQADNVILSAGFGETVIVTVDDLNQVWESDETNNGGSHFISAGPDLIAVTTAAIPTSPSTFTVRATVRNNGDVYAPESLLGIRVNGMIRDNLPVGGLHGGGNGHLETQVTGADGDSLMLTADSKKTVVEKSEVNNTDQLLLKVPDLQVSQAAGSLNFTTGKVEITAEILDLRAAYIPDAVVRVVNHTTGQSITKGVKLIPRGQISLFEAELDGSDGDRISVTVNPFQSIYETSYSNNEDSFNAESGVDLQPISTGVSQGKCAAKLSLRIRNNGTQASPVSQGRLLLTQLGFGGPTIEEVHNLTIPTINPNKVASVNLVLDQTWCPDFRVTLTVDPDNNLPEIDETNNQLVVDNGDSCENCKTRSDHEGER